MLRCKLKKNVSCITGPLPIRLHLNTLLFFASDWLIFCYLITSRKQNHSVFNSFYVSLRQRAFIWNVRRTCSILHIGNTPTLLYFDLYFNTTYKQHTTFIALFEIPKCWCIVEIRNYLLNSSLDSFLLPSLFHGFHDSVV